MEIEPGYYKHFKTKNVYRVFGMAVDEATEKELGVAYQAVTNLKTLGTSGTVWIRTTENFLEEVKDPETNAIWPRFIRMWALETSDG